MKYTVAWSQVLTQNNVLRFAIVSLSLAVIGLLVALTVVTARDPIVIERGCMSQVAATGSTERTDAELNAFLSEALSGRFDSNRLPQEGWLSSEEIQYRAQELKGFQEKEIKQRVLFNQIEKVSGQEILVDADRILSVGSVRSVLPFPLKLTVSSVVRSRGNPYGLRVLQFKSVTKPGDKDAK
ncbi:MAG: hypothetical protein HYZ71_06855 [Deltaproteobacteria bacterium]|nr:hypothetical protein [Deltaproteobacteria bacterium]